MKLLLSDLQKYIPGVNEQNIGILNKIGYEIEIENLSDKLKNFIVAEITACTKIEGAHKLNLCTVNDGTDELQIICGAPNVQVGLKVILAKLKTVMPNGMVIKKAKIKGVISYGMLCSARELELSNEHEGIYELPKEAALGDPISKWIHLDTIINIEITPDKNFATSVLGIANELTRTGQFTSNEELNKKYITTKIQEQTPHHTTSTAYWLNISHIKNPLSPSWLINKLYLLGITSHNFLVDILNYATYITGQPIHVYDADKVQGKLSIQQNKVMDTFTGLDNKKYNIDKNDLVICDEKNNICAIAGLIGSKDTAVTSETKNIIIEIAAFDKKFFDKSKIELSKAYALFYKGIVGCNTNNSLCFIQNILQQNNLIEPHNIISIYGWHYKNKNQHISFDTTQYKDLIGVDLNTNEYERLFSTNGFEIISRQNTKHTILIAENREDIIVSQDIATEYLRFSDYDNLILPKIYKEYNNNFTIATQYDNETVFRLETAKLFAKLKYNEVMTWSFGDEKNNKILDQNCVTISNPLNNELSVLNSSNYSNLLNIAEKNLSRLEEGFKLFTIAPLFHQTKNQENDKNNIHQSYHLSGIVHLLNRNKFHYKNTNIDFYDIKGDIELFLNELGFNSITFETGEYTRYINKYQMAKIIINRKIEIGILGILQPQENLIFFEINLEQLYKLQKRKKQSIDITNKHPIFRDLCFQIDENCKVGKIMQEIQQTHSITQVILLDIHKSNHTITLRIQIETHDNITKEEIQQIEDKIITSMQKKFNITLKT